MEFQHINVKLYLKNPEAIDPHQFNPVFQNWIRNKVTSDLLLDVADYLHVPEGPGMVLVGLECDFALDQTDGRWGLKYNRKKSLEGSDTDRLEAALREALAACQRLESDESLQPKPEFSTNELEIFINDRALAPNTAETAQAFEPLLKTTLEKLYGDNESSWKLPQDPRERFGVTVKTSSEPSLKELLDKLS